MDATTARRRIAERAELRAFISVSDEEGPGPAVAVKDLIDVAGMVTTGGGIILPQEPASHDAKCVASIRRGGALVVGKTNLHEWALGPTSSNPHYGAVRNPHDLERIPGGSSGGSAAAVAAGLCDWAIGTDTGGSIRMPASLCGVVGVKPTLGIVSTDGVIPLAPSLDTVGPLASNVTTAGRALELMGGRSGLAPADPPAPHECFRVAVPQGWVDGLDSATAEVWRSVSAGLPSIAFPDRAEMTATFNAISGYEAGRFHREWVERWPERYGEDVLGRLRTGLLVTPEQYERALSQRMRWRAVVADAMEGWDAVLVPATACVAPRLDGPDRREPLTRFLRPFSVTGQPAVVVPAPSAGLPVGAQFVGHFGRDAQLFRVARAFEAAWSAAEAQTPRMALAWSHEAPL
jgi:aspartyl-tRNA(Asn)/glutamyl-tRNA(Gln) amidotransferase subunit A